MRLIISLSLILSACVSWSQIDVELLKIPKSKQKEYAVLTDYLIRDQKSDSLKAVRIYQWITHNIAYDYKALMSGDILQYKSANAVLKNKKTVCQGYSILYAEMLNHAGILATTVEGYTNDFETDSIPYVTDGDHEWVAFRLGGKWYLCDPTWDAGYVGRKPKFIENPLKLDKQQQKRTARLEKATKEKKKKRLERKFEKKDKAYETKKEKLRGKFSSEIGFVRNPQLAYFMLEPDEFIQSHLPSMPEFQLRANPISLNDFYKKTKSWDTILSRKNGSSIDFNDLCQIHAHRKLHDKWIASAKEGFEFNPLSYGTMALHHYNYLGVNVSDKAREQYEDIEKSDLHESMYQLAIINDSVIAYTKEALKVVKLGYSLDRKQFSAESKAFKSSHKVAKSNTVKSVKAQEKSMEMLKKEDEKTVKALKSLRERETKVLLEAPRAGNPDAYDLTNIPEELAGWKDSLFQTLTTIDSLRKMWDHQIHGPDLLEYRFGLLKFIYENSYYNLYNLNASATYYSDSVVYYDTVIANMSQDLIDFHKEKYREFYYPKEITNALKTLDKQVKLGLSLCKKYGDKHINWDRMAARNYLYGLYYQTLKVVDGDLNTYRTDCVKLGLMEKKYQKYYRQLATNFEKEEEFKEKNIVYNEKIMSKNYQRQQKMYKKLLEEAKKAQEQFAKIK